MPDHPLVGKRVRVWNTPEWSWPTENARVLALQGDWLLLEPLPPFFGGAGAMAELPRWVWAGRPHSLVEVPE